MDKLVKRTCYRCLHVRYTADDCFNCGERASGGDTLEAPNSPRARDVCDLDIGHGRCVLKIGHACPHTVSVAVTDNGLPAESLQRANNGLATPADWERLYIASEKERERLKGELAARPVIKLNVADSAAIDERDALRRELENLKREHSMRMADGRATISQFGADMVALTTEVAFLKRELDRERGKKRGL